MENKNKTFIINLLHQLIKPAMGCTEIGAVALATAASSKHLKKPIKKIYVNLSQFIYRNIVSVGVPLLGKIGTEGIAIAGSVIKNIDKKLNIISELKTNEIKQIKSLMKKNIVKVNVLTNVDPIYVEARIKDVKNNVAVSLIKHAHDNIE
jgi:L-cysteine desulfidase